MSKTSDKLATPAPGTLLPIGTFGGMLAGAGLCVAALLSMLSAHPPPSPLWVSMWILGFANVTASFFAMRRIRIAWSFAISINATAAVVFLLAAPRIRDTFAVNLKVAALPALALVAITTFLALSAHELEPSE